MKTVLKSLCLAVLFLSLGSFAKAQVVRDLNEPVITKEPLTDNREAARMFYLSLAAFSENDRISRLQQIGLSGPEIAAVSPAVISFKGKHDNEASLFHARAMNSQNTEADKSAYIGRLDNELDQFKSNISSKLSRASVKALTVAIDNSKDTASVYHFVFEVPTDAIPDDAARQTSRLQTASYHPGFYPICNLPYPHTAEYILVITGTVTESDSMSSSDGSHFAMALAANGTYSTYFSTSQTCAIQDFGFMFNVEISSTFTDNVGNVLYDGVKKQYTEMPSSCTHATWGPINLSGVSVVDNFVRAQGTIIQGTDEFDVMKWLNGLKTKIVGVTKLFQVAQTWDIYTGGPPPYLSGTWLYQPIYSYCSNTSNPDWNPNFVILTVPDARYIWSITYCTRAHATDVWSCVNPRMTAVPHGAIPYIAPSNCTKTGPQAN